MWRVRIIHQALIGHEINRVGECQAKVKGNQTNKNLKGNKRNTTWQTWHVYLNLMKHRTPWSIQTVQEEQEQNKSSGNKETDQAETGEAITSPDRGRIDYSSESWNRFFSLTVTELLEVKSEYLGTL